MKKIGFIGLGIMGYWMATHLLKKYKTILVFNRSKKNLIKLKKNNSSLKIISTDSLKSIGEQSNFIFSCVGNDSDLEEIYFSRNGSSFAKKNPYGWTTCGSKALRCCDSSLCNRFEISP